MGCNKGIERDEADIAFPSAPVPYRSPKDKNNNKEEQRTVNPVPHIGPAPNQERKTYPYKHKSYAPEEHFPNRMAVEKLNIKCIHNKNRRHYISIINIKVANHINGYLSIPIVIFSLGIDRIIDISERPISDLSLIASMESH